MYYLLSYFRCECPDGRFGVTCDESASACTTGRHQCKEDSKCSVMKDGNYECLCPLGKTGKFCETTVFISDPLFTGGNSFMSLTLDSAIRFNTEINLEIRPDSMDGLIVHFGQSRDARHQDYFTIMLKNSTLVSILYCLLCSVSYTMAIWVVKFSRGIQNWNDFCRKINMPKRNY